MVDREFFLGFIKIHILYDAAKEPIFGIVFLQLDYRLEDDSLEGVRLVQKGSGKTTELAYRGEKTQAVVEVQDGVFSVLLGSEDPIPAWVFDGSIKYLGVQVEDDPEMRPLKPMVSVAYAYRAGTAVGGGGWVDDGAVVRLETATDYVGIGTTEPTAELHVEGDAYISDFLTVGTPVVIDGVQERIGIGTIDP